MLIKFIINKMFQKILLHLYGNWGLIIRNKTKSTIHNPQSTTIKNNKIIKQVIIFINNLK